MKKLSFNFLIIIIFITIFTGCWDQKIYERIGFIFEVGVESGDNKDLIISYIIPVIGNKKGNLSDLLTTHANSIRSAREIQARSSAKILQGGKVQQILFSEEFSEKGIMDVLQIMSRDAINNILAFIVVVDGSPNELMKNELSLQNKPIPGIYITQLLSADVEYSYAVDSRVYNFEIDYFIPGVDPVAPLIKMKPESVEVTGSALFCGDKMVGKINIPETQLLLAMKNKLKKAPRFTFTKINADKTDKIGSRTLTAAINSKKRKIDIKIINDKPVVNISLDFEAVIEDFKWDNENDALVKEKLENDMNTELKATANSLIKHTKEVGSDPIGIGALVKAKYNSYWKNVDWEKVYKTADINFQSKVTITDIGVIK